MKHTVQEYDGLKALTLERSNDLVYERLREGILTGALHPGQRLIESRLALRLGVSRAPIREAFRVLESEGLIRFVARRGVTVALPTKDDVRQIYGLRAALECAAVREAVGRATPEFLAVLSDQITAMERASLSNKRELLAAEDVAFHSAITEFAGNKMLHRVWSGILGQVRMLSREVIGTLYQDVGPIPHRHELILEAIRSGDADLAERAVREHVASVAERMVKAWSRE